MPPSLLSTPAAAHSQRSGIRMSHHLPTSRPHPRPPATTAKLMAMPVGVKWFSTMAQLGQDVELHDAPRC